MREGAKDCKVMDLPLGTIVEGDALKVLRGWPDGSVHAVVTDPPYGLHIMGKAWDKFGTLTGGRRGKQYENGSGMGTPSTDAGSYDHRRNGEYQESMREIFTEALRVLVPGGHCVAFGGPRTFHRLTCAIEDAGFEIRDGLCWLFGEGFPKSKNLHGAWEGWGTALKPGWEPIILARKPLTGTVAANVAEHGAGALNIAACRIVDEARHNASAGNKNRAAGHTVTPVSAGSAEIHGRTSVGRWPANVVHDGSPEVLEAFAGADAGGSAPREWPGDSGSAARFFYCAKARRGEREEGLEGDAHGRDAVREAKRDPSREHGQAGTDNGYNRGAGQVRNHHPTVKPIDLMRWLCWLVTPTSTPGPFSANGEGEERPLPGIVLDPFAGSGTTLAAAAMDGFRWIGIEQVPEYAEIARRRAAHWGAIGVRKRKLAASQTDIFDAGSEDPAPLEAR
jgi:site-specific DNA-methyltransferase (adenine-specific)